MTNAGSNPGKSHRETPQMGNVVVAGESETTVYHNAVEPVAVDPNVKAHVDKQLNLQRLQISKRVSSSSEEGFMNTSDELLDTGIDNLLPGSSDVVKGDAKAVQMNEPQPGRSQQCKQLRIPQLAMEPQELDKAAQMV